MKQHFVLVILVLILDGLAAFDRRSFLRDIESQQQKCYDRNGYPAVQSLENALRTYGYKLLNNDILMNRIVKTVDGGVNADHQLCLGFQSITKSGDDVLRAMAACSVDVTSLTYTDSKTSMDIVQEVASRVCSGINVSTRNPFTTHATTMSGDKFLLRECSFTTFAQKHRNYDIMNRIIKTLDGGVTADNQLCLDIQSMIKSNNDVLRAIAECSIDVTSSSYTVVKTSMDILQEGASQVCPGIGVSTRNPFTTHATTMSGDKYLVRVFNECEVQVIVDLMRCNYLDAKQMEDTSQVIAQMNKKLEGVSTDCNEHSKEQNCVLEQGRLLQHCSENVHPLMSSELKTLLDAPPCDTDWIGRSKSLNSANSSPNVYLLLFFCAVISLSITISIVFFMRRKMKLQNTVLV